MPDKFGLRLSADQSSPNEAAPRSNAASAPVLASNRECYPRVWLGLPVCEVCGRICKTGLAHPSLERQPMIVATSHALAARTTPLF